jgi:hypothetical protein
MPTLIVDGPEKASTRTLSKNVPDYGGQVRTASSLPGSPDRRGAVLDPNHSRNSLQIELICNCFLIKCATPCPQYAADLKLPAASRHEDCR